MDVWIEVAGLKVFSARCGGGFLKSQQAEAGGS
jgi:hypothetical protein